MRLFQSIILITITLLACYIEDIYLNFWPTLADKAVHLTIRSRQSFRFDQQKALDVKRKKALAQYVPVYRYVPQSVDASKQKFEAFGRAFSTYKGKEETDIDSLRFQVQKEFGVGLSRTEIGNIVKYRDLKNLLEGILTIEESILQNKILIFCEKA